MTATTRSAAIAAMALLAVASLAPAEQLTVNPSQDTTLYESSTGTLGNGAGVHLFAGRTNQSSGSVRRGLLAFDLSAIPAGSTVTSVTLTMRMSRSISGEQSVTLHRVLSDWGEGGSDATGNEGAGAPAASGDATWVHTFFDTDEWVMAGGDFRASASAATAVSGVGSYTWGSSSGLLDDVQGWVDSPSTNRGWLVMGNEASTGTAKRFDSRESTNPPQLTVTYEMPSSNAGSIAFSAAAYSFGEAQGTATIQVVRSGGSDGQVAVAYVTAAGSATVGVDYGSASGIVSWADGEDGAKSFEVDLFDDSIMESPETVNLMLSNPQGGASLGSPSSAVLTIVDDDGDVEPGLLEFADVGFVGSEAAGMVEVTVTRRDGSDGQVSVGYTSQALSATPGSDYTAVTGILTWGDGESGGKTFMVPVADDDEEERTELVRLLLADPSGGAEIRGNRTSVAAIVDDDGDAGCSASADNLCLLSDRFRIETEWRDQRTGNHGLGSAVSDSNRTGFFWFFDAANIELIVKMLDGRQQTGAWWLFYGGLSDVEYWVIATDTETGDVHLYRNDPGSICGVGDTRAFPEGDAKAAGRVVPRPLERRMVAFDATSAAGFTVPKQGSCAPDAETLCLLNDRFAVSVSWEDQRTGSTGVGTAVTGTDNSGYYWFFSSTNLELVVKVLNGTPVNGKIWFFYGALSDVIYTITVTDTATGEVREYTNPAGNICGNADTSAFDPE